MVAHERAAKAVLDEPGGTVRAFVAVAAGAAERERRVAAAVEEQERLLAGVERVLHREGQRRREPASFLGGSRRRSMARICGRRRPPKRSGRTRRRYFPRSALTRSRSTGSPRPAPPGSPRCGRAPPPCRGRGSRHRPPACRRPRAPHRPRSAEFLEGQEQRRARPGHHPGLARRDRLIKLFAPARPTPECQTAGRTPKRAENRSKTAR
jgi:hypothetical protein